MQERFKGNLQFYTADKSLGIDRIDFFSSKKRKLIVTEFKVQTLKGTIVNQFKKVKSDRIVYPSLLNLVQTNCSMEKR